MFPTAVTNFLLESISDHCPCVIKIDTQRSTKPKPIRFVNMWTLTNRFMALCRVGDNSTFMAAYA